MAVRTNVFGVVRACRYPEPSSVLADAWLWGAVVITQRIKTRSRAQDVDGSQGSPSPASTHRLIRHDQRESSFSLPSPRRIGVRGPLGPQRRSV
jgi:hypothetical protein